VQQLIKHNPTIEDRQLIISPKRRNTPVSKNKLSISALIIAGTLAMLSSASATSISEDIAVGGTLIGTVTLTQGGTGSCTGFSSTSVCVDVEMTSGSVRVGGPVIGFSGNVNEGGTSIVSDVSGGFALAPGACGGITMETICLDANGSATTSSLLFVLSNAEISTGITVGNIHVAGEFCGSNPTCFATTTPVSSTVPEPGTLGLLGTGILALAGVARHRFRARRVNIESSEVASGQVGYAAS
jgi:hypothetical protein